VDEPQPTHDCLSLAPVIGGGRDLQGVRDVGHAVLETCETNNRQRSHQACIIGMVYCAVLLDLSRKSWKMGVVRLRTIDDVGDVKS